MSHPYPRHLKDFSYIGRYHYFLTFCCSDRCQLFTCPDTVALVLQQILRAAAEKQFEITAYCFMPDHLHMLVKGLSSTADGRAFIKAAKQYSGFAFRKSSDNQLWQRYGYEHVVREDIEVATTIRYILDNPMRAGLVSKSSDYAFRGSQCHTVSELEQLASSSDEARIPR